MRAPVPAAPKRIAIIGDRGIPARYSGFSTLAEELATRLVAEHGMQVTVYCRRQYFDRHPPAYRGVTLIYHRAPGGKSFESLLHTLRAIRHALGQRFDLVFVVDPGNGPLILPLVAAGIPVVLHTDGMGWLRRKWGPAQRRYYRWSEWVSARLATALVTDARVMHDYYKRSYGAPSAIIPYGARVGSPPADGVPQRFGLQPGRYFLVVARLEPENNVDLIIREYRRSGVTIPLAYVGGARFASDHARAVTGEADAKVRLLGPVYDPALLNGLYRDCRAYVHGHEVGGTNPSLLRAMGAGAACMAIDVSFHREVLGNAGVFFTKGAGDLAGRLHYLETDDAAVRRLQELSADRAQRRYRWDAVAAAYAELFRHVIRGAGRRRQVPPPQPYHPERYVGRPRAASASVRRAGTDAASR